jgi:hypothetical protein
MKDSSKANQQQILNMFKTKNINSVPDSGIVDPDTYYS